MADPRLATPAATRARLRAALISVVAVAALAAAGCQNAPPPRASQEPERGDDVRFVFAPTAHPSQSIEIRYGRHALTRFEASGDARTAPYAEADDGRSIQVVTAQHLLMVTVSGERVEIADDAVSLDGAALATWPQALVIDQQGAVALTASW
jgi:hypothetical protein